MTQRLHIVIRGAVQGVGFRPFIYRLATELQLNGWIANSPQGVFIDVEGSKERLDGFLLRIEKEKPPLASIQSIESSFLDPRGYDTFVIRRSNHEGERSALVLPDIALCRGCLAEMLNPTDRRYLYPFTNCTHCGPRFSIIECLPYDRNNTSMNRFEMCDACQEEYNNPLNRRFHAQPNACPACGPHVELWDADGTTLSVRHRAMHDAAQSIRNGMTLAVKGLGGFHLMVDARNDEAVRRLRQRKHREEKPLAVMFPSIKMAEAECDVSGLEARLLHSPEAPIVLLERKFAIHNSQFTSQKRLIVSRERRTVNSQIAPSVAPNNPSLGAMLPYTPLHQILLRELGFPVVATSGNISDEPICIDEFEALERLKGIADVFLVHNRPILRHVDDSVVRIVSGREQVLRRARGYAPLPIAVNECRDRNYLAVGGHQKNTVAITSSHNVFISQHIGDLETEQAHNAFRNVVKSLTDLFGVEPKQVVADLHPDYLSTQFAQKLAASTTHIQHHYAHVASCMAENELDGCVLGVSWDGTGYGLDGTIWGGEFLLTNEHSFERVATFKSFRLPGGSKAVKEPRRTALGLLYEIFGKKLHTVHQLHSLKAFSESELNVILQMLEKNINSPTTSSVGRLFDAVASIVNLRQRVSFEGQAAMEMEFAIDAAETDDSYQVRIIDNQQSLIVVDWSPMIIEIIGDVDCNTTLSLIAAKFHNTLVEVIVAIAGSVGNKRVVLTGGCFQNKYLTERAVMRLQKEGFRPYWHQRVPPNDGGIALGQICAASRLVHAQASSDKQIKQLEEFEV